MRFVSRVESIKQVRGKTIVTALGSQKNISMTGINPPMEIIDGGGERFYVEKADIVGFTCIEDDVLQRGYSGKVGIGDYVVMKPPFILPNFAIIDICGDKEQVIKSAESFEDLFHTYSF